MVGGWIRPHEPGQQHQVVDGRGLGLEYAPVDSLEDAVSVAHRQGSAPVFAACRGEVEQKAAPRLGEVHKIATVIQGERVNPFDRRNGGKAGGDRNLAVADLDLAAGVIDRDLERLHRERD